jgi:Cu-Zn family superoxide dismutase
MVSAMRTTLAVTIWLALALTACGDDEPADETSDKSASAALAPTTGNSATGTATFSPVGTQIKLNVSIANAPPGVHGFHIHQMPACGADGMDAGGHWDPTTMMHGAWTAGAHHLGDVGNITADASGNGTLELTTDAWSIGTGATNDVVGHSVVLHASADDFATQPTGNAGGRIACGVIALD